MARPTNRDKNPPTEFPVWLAGNDQGEKED